jgi:engulfment/cell motility protein 1
MSTGASISDPISSTSTPKDDKVLKMATFSLQKYLKVRAFFVEEGKLLTLYVNIGT